MSGTEPLCSVVIPTYNAAATLDATLAALAAQEGVAPFEVVVADNGSVDDSAEVARRWADRLPLLRVVDASRARGVAAARNDGIRAARGDVVLLCDADDVTDPGWVAAMLGPSRRPTSWGAPSTRAPSAAAAAGGRPSPT